MCDYISSVNLKCGQPATDLTLGERASMETRFTYRHSGYLQLCRYHHNFLISSQRDAFGDCSLCSKTVNRDSLWRVTKAFAYYVKAVRGLEGAQICRTCKNRHVNEFDGTPSDLDDETGSSTDSKLGSNTSTGGRGLKANGSTGQCQTNAMSSDVSNQHL